MAEMPDRVLQTPARLKQSCEIVMAVAMIRIALQRLLICGDRLGAALLVLEKYA